MFSHVASHTSRRGSAAGGASADRLAPVTVLLVRHADAGSRGGWREPDLLRPLTDAGRAQARGIVRLLGDRFAVDEIVSSPSVRCVETVAALAAVLAVDIRIDPALAEGEDPGAAVELARRAADPGPGLVLCSHGDLIPAMLEVLEFDGLDLGPRPQCQKGSTWVLAGEHGRFHTSQYLPPP